MTKEKDDGGSKGFGNRYSVIESATPQIIRRTIETEKGCGSLSDLIDETEQLVKCDLGSKLSLSAMGTINSLFHGWFGKVLGEDKKKIGDKWGVASQVSFNYGIPSIDNSTIWKFSWDNIQAEHSANRVMYQSPHSNDYIEDDEKWTAVLDNHTGKVLSFAYDSARKINYWNRHKNENLFGKLANKSMKMDFDEDGNLNEVTFSKNLDLPSKIHGNGSEIIRTWSIGNNTTHHKR